MRVSRHDISFFIVSLFQTLLLIYLKCIRKLQRLQLCLQSQLWKNEYCLGFYRYDVKGVTSAMEKIVYRCKVWLLCTLKYEWMCWKYAGNQYCAEVFKNANIVFDGVARFLTWTRIFAILQGLFVKFKFCSPICKAKLLFLFPFN